MDRETQRLLERATVDLEPPRGLEDVKGRAHQRHVRARVIAGVTAGVVALAGVGGSIALLETTHADHTVQVSPTPVPPLAENGRIAFVRVDRASALVEGNPPSAALLTVDPTGSNPTKIVDLVGAGSSASWSPDGTRLAYTYAGLWIASQDGTDHVNVLPCGGPPCSGLGGPAWSPDGTRLAFWMDDSKRGEGVWLINTDGSGLMLLSPGLSVGQPTWSPDGSQLAVSGHTADASKPAIFVLDATTGQILRTIQPSGVQPSSGISWSPDGRRLAFDATGPGGSVQGAGIYLIDPDGGDMSVAVTWQCPSSNVCLARTPEWSPDGRFLAFTASTRSQGSDGSEGQLRVLDMQTREVRVLTKGYLDCCPSWQPLPAPPTGDVSSIRKRISEAEATYSELVRRLRHAQDALARARASGDVVRIQTALTRVTALEAAAESTRARIGYLTQLLSQQLGGNVSPSPPTGSTGFPPVTVTPAHGPVGTRVSIEGDGFTGPDWQDPSGGYGVFLLRDLADGCELIAGNDVSVHVNGTGHLVAHVTVSSTGSCFQSGREERVRPGTYQIGIACHACELGTFVVNPR
jgi:hypothetical protein